jgi:hypothetical protein
MIKQRNYIYLLIFALLFFSSKWITTFFFEFNENLLTKIIFDTSDIEYYPVVLSISKLNFFPSFLQDLSSEKILQFPLTSIIIHSFFYKLFGIYSFIMLEFLFKFFLIYVLFKILTKLEIDHNLALVATFVIFLVTPTLNIFDEFYDIKYISLLRNLFEGNFGFRFPRPLVTEPFLFLTLFLLIDFRKKISEKINYKYFFSLSILLGFLLNSFFYFFLIIITEIVIIYILHFRKNFFLSIKRNLDKIFLLFLLILITTLPFLFQVYYGEKDYGIRLGFVEPNIAQRIILAKHFIFGLIRPTVLLLLFFCLLLKIYFSEKNYKDKKNTLDIFFYFFISSILTTLVFILFSPKITSLDHFINIIIFSGILYILFCLLNFVDNQIKFDNNFCFIIATISIISFFLHFTITFNKQERNQFNQVVNFMRNNNYNHTSLNLYTNSIKMQNLWLLLGNEYLVSSDYFSNSLTNKEIEDLMINALKGDLNFSEIDFKKILNLKNGVRNDFLMRFFGYRYQANSFYTHDKLEHYEIDNQEIIKKTSPFRNQMQIISEKEKKRLISKFKIHQYKKNFGADILILDNTNYYLINKNKKFKLKFENKNYKIYKKI